MTQEELAKRAGVRQSHISRIESGDIKDIRGATLATLAKTLGVTTDHLLGLDEIEDEDETSAVDKAVAKAGR
jgi:transcriptional regulator with XRE-family HTH domain